MRSIIVRTSAPDAPSRVANVCRRLFLHQDLRLPRRLVPANHTRRGYAVIGRLCRSRRRIWHDGRMRRCGRLGHIIRTAIDVSILRSAEASMFAAPQRLPVLGGRRRSRKPRSAVAVRPPSLRSLFIIP